MRQGSLRQGPVVGFAAAVLGVLIAQIALAGGTSTSERGDIASLKRDNASLHRQINQLKAQVGAKKKSRRGPAGPQGPQGPAGAQGATGGQGIQGESGSPDSGEDILAKLAPVDGSGSGLDADLVDGVHSALLQRRNSVTNAGNSSTPGVSNLSLLVLDYSGSSVTISNLASGVEGQLVTIVTADGIPDITDGGNFRLSANWAPDADDSLTVAFHGGIWYEVARSAN